MPDFHCELYQLLAADLSNRRATFVIKQKKLLPSVNIGDLIETDTGAVENWTVNHCVPARLAFQRGLHRYWQIIAFALIGHYRNLTFISIPIIVIVLSTSRCSCDFLQLCLRVRFGNGLVGTYCMSKEPGPINKSSYFVFRGEKLETKPNSLKGLLEEGWGGKAIEGIKVKSSVIFLWRLKPSVVSVLFWPFFSAHVIWQFFFLFFSSLTYSTASWHWTQKYYLGF